MHLRRDNKNDYRRAIAFTKLFKLRNKLCNNMAIEMKTKEPTKSEVGSTEQLLKIDDNFFSWNKISIQS